MDYLELGIGRAMQQYNCTKPHRSNNTDIPKVTYTSFGDWLEELFSSKVTNLDDPKVKHINNEITNSTSGTPPPFIRTNCW